MLERVMTDVTRVTTDHPWLKLPLLVPATFIGTEVGQAVGEILAGPTGGDIGGPLLGVVVLAATARRIFNTRNGDVNGDGVPDSLTDDPYRDYR